MKHYAVCDLICNVFWNMLTAVFINRLCGIFLHQINKLRLALIRSCMKAYLWDHVPKQIFAICLKQYLGAAPVYKLYHINMKQFIFHKKLSAFIKSFKPGIQIRSALLCALNRLFKAPCIYLFLIAWHEYLRHLFVMPLNRTWILRVFKQIAMKRLCLCRNVIVQHPRNQTWNCIYHHHRRQFSAC